MNAVVELVNPRVVYELIAPILSWVDIKDLGIKGRISAVHITAGSVWYMVEYWLDGRMIEVELQASDLQVPS